MKRKKQKSIYVTFFWVWLILVVGSWMGVFFVSPLEWIWSLFIALNLASFFLFGWDKAVAGSRWSRIPERILHLSTFVGGSLGAVVAMHLFRHKTRKSDFQIVMYLLILVQMAAMYFIWMQLKTPTW